MPLGAWAVEGAAAQERYVGAWRSLAYQLPGAYRFIDRLALTEEQQKALDKVQKDWAAQRQEAYGAAMKDFPPLSAEDQKDPQKVKEYYAKRTDVLKAAQVPPPVDYVHDILTEDQLNKISEARKVMEGWERWLAQNLGEYDRKLDGILGPAPEDPTGTKQYTYQMFSGFVAGGSLLGRLRLTPAQDAALQEIRKQYYSEYGSLWAPLGQPPAGGVVSYQQMNAVRAAIATKGWAELKEKYRILVDRLLTEEQRERLAKALAATEERDEAVWKRYSQYVADLSAILPVPPPVSQSSAVSPNPAGETKNGKPK